MPSPHIKLGKQSGEHGSYSFYRSFSYLSGGKWRNVQLGRFFFLKLGDNSPICIGELQLVWTGRYSNHPLTSIRLYYLPEQLPDGRQSHHGQDEVVATDKMVIHAKDLITWIIHEGVEWGLGLSLKSTSSVDNNCKCSKKNTDGLACNVQIIDFTKYCRLRTALKRTGGRLYEEMANHPELSAIYGLSNIKSPNNYIMFCKETFESPELENHDFRCDHLAPNLKGRPRKKGKGKHIKGRRKSRGGGSSVSVSSAPVETLKSPDTDETDKKKEAEKYEKMLKQVLASKEYFTKTLYKHMKDQGTPILKIPSLGFKKVDLYMFFKHAYSVGGYREICRRRLWKNIYDRLGGSPHNTSAASCAKRQYERLLLSFEKHVLRSNNARVGIKIPPMQQRKPPLLRTAVQLRDRYTELRRCEIRREKPLGLLSASQQESNTSKQIAAKPLLQVDVDDDVPLSMLAPLKTTIASKTAAATVVTLSSSDSSLPAVVDCESLSAPVSSAVATGTVWNIPSPLSTSAFSSTSTRLEKSSNNLLKSPRSQSACLSAADITLTSSTVTTSSSSNSQLLTSKFSVNKAGLSGGLLPAHCLLKAPMPLHVLGPCHPHQLTSAQRCPWTKQLHTNYHRPICADGSTIDGHKLSDLKRALPEEALDLSAKRQRLIPQAHTTIHGGGPQVFADDCGALDLTMNHDKPLALIKAKSESAADKSPQNWKTQDEPLNYSKVKKANSNVNPCIQPPPPLVHRDLVMSQSINSGGSYLHSPSADVSHYSTPRPDLNATKILQPSPQYPAHMNSKLVLTAGHRHLTAENNLSNHRHHADKGIFDHRKNMLPTHPHTATKMSPSQSPATKKITTAHHHAPPNKSPTAQHRLASPYERFRSAERLVPSATSFPPNQSLTKPDHYQEVERAAIRSHHQTAEDVITSQNPAAERLMTAAHHLAAVSYKQTPPNSVQRLPTQSANPLEYYHPKPTYGAQYPDRSRRMEPKKLEIDLTRDDERCNSSSSSANRPTSKLTSAHMSQLNTGRSQQVSSKSHMAGFTRLHSPSRVMTSPRLHSSNHTMNSSLLHSPNHSMTSPRLHSPNHTLASPRLHSPTHIVNRSRHLPPDQPLMRGPPPRYSDYHRRVESAYSASSSQHSSSKSMASNAKTADSKHKPQPNYHASFIYEDTARGGTQHSQPQERRGLPSPQLLPHLRYPALTNHQGLDTSRHSRIASMNSAAAAMTAVSHTQPSLQRLPPRIDSQPTSPVRYVQLPAPPRLQPIPLQSHGLHRPRMNKHP